MAASAAEVTAGPEPDVATNDDGDEVEEEDEEQDVGEIDDDEGDPSSTPIVLSPSSGDAEAAVVGAATTID